MAGWKFFLNAIEVEEPIGWDSVEFTAIRQDLHGVDQPFSSALQFYGKGAKLLQNAFQENFVSASVALLITSDQVVNGLPFQYNGMVDFSTYEEINSCDSDSWSVSVGILQDTFRDKFKARFDAEVDVIKAQDLDGNTINSGLDFEWVRYVLMHSQRLALFGYAQQLIGTSKEINKLGLNWSRDEFCAVVPVYWGNTDFQDIFGSTTDVTGLTYSTTNVIFQDNSNQGVTRRFTLRWERIYLELNFFYTTKNDVPFGDQSMNVILTINVFNSDGTDYALHYMGQSDICFYSYTIPTEIPAGAFTFDVPPNGRVAFYIQWGGGGNIDVGTTGQGNSNWEFKANLNIFGSRFSIEEQNQGLASYCYAYPVERILRRVIYQITGQNNKLLSNCFSENADGVYANNCITTGLLLRNFFQSNKNVRTSFKKLIEGLAAIFGIGWAFEWTGSEWKIRVEPIEYFYQNVVELEVQNVETLKTTAVNDKFYGQLKLGYSNNWKNMSLGGVDAIGTDRVYFIDNKAIKYGQTSTIELQSDIIGEGIAIEYSRRLQFFDTNSGSSDRPNDYNLFIIWTIREQTLINYTTNPEYKTIAGQSGTSLRNKYTTSWSSRLLNGSTLRAGDGLVRYNLFHTGTRIALRQWALLGMNTFGMLNPVMRFQVGEYRTRFDSAINDVIQPNVIEDTSPSPSGAILLAEDSDLSTEIIRPEFQEYLLKPIIFEFEYPQAFCDFIQLANYTPYRKVKVSIGSTVVSGWILEIKNKPEDNSGGTTVFRIIGANIPDPEPPPPPQLGAYSEAYSNAYN